MSPLVSLRSVDAGYRGVPVVRDLDLEVDQGEVVALLGANGAGKTTTLATMSGLLPPVRGHVDVLGRAAKHGGRGIARRVAALARAGLAHVPEDRALFPTLDGHEHLRLAARRGDGAAITDALEPFPALVPLLDRPAGLLSGGEQQMLALARALAGRPRVLLVDELSLGLAPIVVHQLLPTVRAIARDRGVAVVLVEQHVGAALAVADRAVVLRRGRVALEGPAAELAGRDDLLAASYLGAAPPAAPPGGRGPGDAHR